MLEIIILFSKYNYSKNYINFGKYKGKKFSDLPTEYLEWLVSNVSKVKVQASDELEKRLDIEKEKPKKAHSYKNTILGIIERERECWKCKKTTPVVALKLYSNIEENDYFDIQPGITCFLEKLDNKVLKKIQEKYPFYKYTYSKTFGGKYLANCCIHCNSLQGDFQLHQEINGAFFNIDDYSFCDEFIVKYKEKLSYSSYPKK
ncbi:putative quorum-sensing-regulated virulence factor [Aliarcobacter thereius]|uniref:putative quorum-sensing-regulated virulence factor n=1 Tax=Aliarcobacter thereius TaxID=544718 RepID=UPI0013F4F950|nr:DUF3820 family protein [Aliarcobacter thereius]